MRPTFSVAEMAQLMPLIPRCPGTKFVCEMDGPVDRLEPIEHGNWRFIRAHMRDGTVRDIRPDGKPVIMRGET